MIDFFDTHFMQHSWFKPLLIAAILLPVFVVLFNEIIFRAKTKEALIVPPIRMMRNIVLPLVGIFIVATQLLEYSREQVPTKIVETLLYILVLNALLAILNVLFFSRGDQSLVKTQIPQLFLDIFRILLVMLGTAIILSAVWGADLASMVTALGVGSFVLGLALQDTLGNLFAGIALIYEKPFRVGDYIEVEDKIGKVVEMNWRTVRIVDTDDKLIIVPHMIIGASTVVNLSYPAQSYLVEHYLKLTKDIPPHTAKSELVKIMLNTPGIMEDPMPGVSIEKYKKKSIEYGISFNVASYEDGDDILDDFLTRVWYLSKRQQLPYLPETKEQTSNRSDEAHYTLIKQELSVLLDLFPLKKHQLTGLERGTKFLIYGQGEYIIKKGEISSSLYILKSGKVKLIAEKEDIKSAHYLYKGDFFGEISIVSPSNYSVRVEEDVSLLEISNPFITKLIKENPKLVYYISDTNLVDSAS